MPPRGGITRAGQRLRHPVVSESGGATEDEQIAGHQLEVGVGLAAGLGVAEAKQAGIAHTERHHRVVGAFVLVLVHAHPGRGVVIVDQGRIRVVVVRGVRVSVGVDQGAAAQLHQPTGQFGHSPTADVIGCAGVAVGLPMPAQTYRPHRHLMAARQCRRPDRHRPTRPFPTCDDDPVLFGGAEPVGQMDGSRRQLPTLTG